MKKTGPLATCIKQVADLYGSEQPDKREAVPVRCLLQGKLLTSLSLMPGEAAGMSLRRLGEALSLQARISSYPLEQQSATLEYNETGIGTVINDQRVVGTLCLEGETDPAPVLYRPDPQTAMVQQQ